MLKCKSEIHAYILSYMWDKIGQNCLIPPDQYLTISLDQNVLIPLVNNIYTPKVYTTLGQHQKRCRSVKIKIGVHKTNPLTYFDCQRNCVNCCLSLEGQYFKLAHDFQSTPKAKFQSQWSIRTCYHSLLETFIKSTLQAEVTTFVNTKVRHWWTWRILYPPLWNYDFGVQDNFATATLSFDSFLPYFFWISNYH